MAKFVQKYATVGDKHPRKVRVYQGGNFKMVIAPKSGKLTLALDDDGPFDADTDPQALINLAKKVAKEHKVEIDQWSIYLPAGGKHAHLGVGRFGGKPKVSLYPELTDEEAANSRSGGKSKDLGFNFK